MLSLTLEKIKARERLEDARYSGTLTMGEFYDLCLEAGYSEEAASRAASIRGWERLNAGVMM